MGPYLITAVDELSLNYTGMDCTYTHLHSRCKVDIYCVSTHLDGNVSQGLFILRSVFSFQTLVDYGVLLSTNGNTALLSLQ